MFNKHVHSTVTRSSRFHCLISVINKPTTVELYISVTCIPTTCCGEIFLVHNVEIAHVTVTTPIREHSLITRLRLRMADSFTKYLKSLALAVAEILHGM